MNYKKTEEYDQELTDKIANRFSDIISGIGEDSSMEGLVKTPERASKAMQFLTHGYDLNAEEILRSALFTEDYSEMVIVKDIELYSLC